MHTLRRTQSRPAVLTRRRATLAVLAFLVLAAAPVALTAKPEFKAVEPHGIAIEARPIPFDRENPERRRFGALTWLGGVRLTSPSRLFGGWSGLALDADGARLIAVSDAGLWLTGRLEYDGGRIDGMSDARIGSILGADGKALEGIPDTDAEAVTPSVPGPLSSSIYIAFERNHRIGVFPVAGGGVGKAGKFLTLPRGVRAAKSNSGLEGMAVLQGGPFKGALVAFSENLTDAKGNHRGWLIGGPRPGGITLKRMDGFSVTDLAALPDGGLLVLERHFAWSTGVRMRIRRITAKDIRPGALLDGQVLIEAGPALQIDNMEAMAAHTTPSGETVITLLSDDNYNPIQRTLLLQFRLDKDVSSAR